MEEGQARLIVEVRARAAIETADPEQREAQVGIMRAALKYALPAPEEWAFIQEQGTLAVLASRSLFLLALEESPQEEPPTRAVRFRRLPVDDVPIGLHERFEDQASGLARVRRWTFGVDDPPLSWETRHVVSEVMFSQMPREELLARRLANEIGWEVPSAGHDPNVAPPIDTTAAPLNV